MNIKLAVFDFDGVFNDRIYVSNNNVLTKSYDPKDSYGLQLLKNNNIKIGILSACSSDIIPCMEKIMSRIDFISTGNYDKYSVIKEWTKELNIDLQNISYIGDDVFDIEVMNNVGFSGCPYDAVEECKVSVNYVCKNKGGHGAVREFCNEILTRNKYNVQRNISNIKKNGKITCVIPVRSGSIRCKNKNIRQFNDTNLLVNKINILKQVEEIDNIIVSSNCDQMLEIAKQCGVNIEKRDPYYARSETTGSELYKYISNVCDNEILCYANVVAPLVTVENIKNMIKIYRNKNYDSVSSVINLKHFMWKNNKPFNFNTQNTPRSQDLDNIYSPTFGVMIIDKKYVYDTTSLIGYNPYFYELSQIEGIDIDTNYDFIVAELLYKNNLLDEQDITNYMNRCDMIKTELLDCTIRDGGYINNWNFTDEEVLECYKAVSKANYDYFEIGFMREKYDKNNGLWFSTGVNDVKRIIDNYDGCKIAVMISVDNNKNIYLEHSNITKISLIRLHVRFNDDINYNIKILTDVVYMCNKFKQNGYEVCLNIASSNRLCINDIKLICEYIHNLDLKCVYCADTFGSFDNDSTRNMLYQFQKMLYKFNSQIPLAFHAHNNMSNALEKTKIALDFKVKMIDSTIYGLGRGAGNLQSELIILELNKRLKQNKYNVLPVIEYGEKYIRDHSHKLNLKYNYNDDILYTITGYYDIHPNYVDYLREKYNNHNIKTLYDCLIYLKNSSNLYTPKLIDDFFLTYINKN